MSSSSTVRLSASLGVLVLLAACGGGNQASLTGTNTAQADLTANTQGTLTARVNTKACLDVVNNSSQSGAAVQIWQCTGGTNQTWQVKDKNVMVYGTLCLAESGTDNGSKVTVVTCNTSDASQGWTVDGEHLINTASNRCLDVRNGGVTNGTKLQVWDCAKGNSNQAWLMPNAAAIAGSTATDPNASTTPAVTPTAPATSSSTNVTSAITQPVTFADWGINGGFTAMPLNQLLALHPQLSSDQQDFVTAAAQASPNIPPQLLVAICLQESSGGLDSANGGPFQFTDNGAWNTYGPKGGDRYNMGDAAIGAANYIADLLKSNGGDLNAALRNYNGPISQGGNPQYQAQIQQWMQGTLVYGSGV